MLRSTFFAAVIVGGAHLLQALELLAGAEALLVAGIFASVLLFILPESSKTRDPEDLIFRVVSVIAVYAIVLKLRPWMAGRIGGLLAVVVTLILLLAFAGLLVWRSSSRTTTLKVQ